MACPVVRTNPRRKETNMRTIRVRERTATPEELEEDRRRCLAARESIRSLRADLKRTTNSPAVTMAELVESSS
jgi:hypothetical protein